MVDRIGVALAGLRLGGSRLGWEVRREFGSLADAGRCAGFGFSHQVGDGMCLVPRQGGWRCLVRLRWIRGLAWNLPELWAETFWRGSGPPFVRGK